MVSTDTATGFPPGEGTKPPLVISDRDIVFNCPACHGELVVDRDGAGMSVPCSHCGQPLTIPDHALRTTGPVAIPSTVSGLPTLDHRDVVILNPPRHFDFKDQPREQLERRLGDLKHQMKENRSQDTEMRGHVNRATMDLHRLQLKLKKLQERQTDIDAELDALGKWLDAGAA